MTYELPAEWRVVPFSQIAEYRLGRTPARKTSRFWADGTTGFPWVSIADLQPFGTVKSTSESVTFDAYKEVFQGQLVPAGTLLMSFKLTIGRTSILDIDAFHNEAIISIYPREGVHREYLKFYLPTIDFADHQDRAVKGQTLNRGKIDRLPVVLPPLDEQIAIANVLEALRSQVENEAAICGKLAALKSATMAKLFREGLRGEPLKQTEIGEIPESWEVVRLGDIAKVGNGSTPKRTNEAYWQGGHIPWITSTKIHEVIISKADEFITETAFRECHLPLVPRKSLVVAITGQGKTLGNVGLLDLDTCINQHLAYVQFQDSAALPEFYLFYLQSLYAYFRQVSSSGGSTKGALTCAFIANLKVPFPCEEEQEEIAEALMLLTHRHKIATKRLEALSNLFGAVLPQLMTGAIRVKDLDLAEVSHA